MKNYSGKQLVKARTKAGYKTRDSFFQNLKVYLEKQKRDLEINEDVNDKINYNNIYNLFNLKVMEPGKV